MADSSPEKTSSKSDCLKHKPSTSSHFTVQKFNSLQLLLHDNVFFIYSNNADQSADRGVLVLIARKTSVVVHGKVIVKPLVGSLSVNGSNLTCNVDYELYSPSSHSHLVLKSSNDPNMANIQDLSQLPLLKHLFKKDEEDDLQTALDFLKTFVKQESNKEEMCLLYASPLINLSCELISKFSSFNKLFKGFNGDPIGILFGFSFINIKIEDYHAFQETSEMKKVKGCLEDIQAKRVSESCNKPLCVLAVGAKNSGKSTLMRYLTNQLRDCLSGDNKVAWLECDIGQPEFTPSGFVSLTLVEECVLGPPFTHQLRDKPRPIRQCFVGTLSPADDPSYYSDCLKYVFEAYQHLDPKPPLIINTMGWVTGLGQLFLADQIFMSRPDLIIQLQVNNRKMNSEPLTNQYMQTLSGWIHKDLGNAEFDHKLLIFNSVGGSSSFGAPAQRELTLLSHLLSSLSTLPPCLPEALLFPNGPTSLGAAAWVQSRLPYMVSYCRPTNPSTSEEEMEETDSSQMDVTEPLLALYLIHPDVRPFSQDQILPVFNASLVALCKVSDDLIETPSDVSFPHTLKKNPICHCFGLGVVRAMDPQKGVLYVITGVPEDELKGVNCLVKGPSIDLPACLFQDQLNSESSPYLHDFLSCGIGKMSIPNKRFIPKVNKHQTHRSSHPM